VVGVRDQAGAHAQDGERVDLEVRGVRRDVALVQRQLRRVLLVDVQVLDEALADEVLPIAHALGELGHVRGGHGGQLLLDDDERAADAAGVGGDVHRALRRVQLHRDELAQAAAPAERAERAHERLRVAVDAEQHAVDEDEGAARVGAEVEAGEHVHVLHAQVHRQPRDRRLLVVRRHVRGERKVFDEPARLALGRVGRAEHAPLRGLERARARDLARLLELRHDARHHPERLRPRGRARARGRAAWARA
jgi:hypothetical protein